MQSDLDMSAGRSSSSRYQKNPRLMSAVLPDGSWTLFNVEDESVVVLTATAGILWDLCDGSHDLPGLMRAIEEIYPSEEKEILRRDVHGALDDFQARGLVSAT